MLQANIKKLFKGDGHLDLKVEELLSVMSQEGLFVSSEEHLLRGLIRYTTLLLRNIQNSRPHFTFPIFQMGQK